MTTVIVTITKYIVHNEKCHNSVDHRDSIHPFYIYFVLCILLSPSLEYHTGIKVLVTYCPVQILDPKSSTEFSLKYEGFRPRRTDNTHEKSTPTGDSSHT